MRIGTYVFAVQSVESGAPIGPRSPSSSSRTTRRGWTLGTMAPIDVVQAQSQAATARQTLATAVGTLRTNELALKRLIVSGTNDPNWNADLDPTDRPDSRRRQSTSPRPSSARSMRAPMAQVRKNLEVNMHDVAGRVHADARRRSGAGARHAEGARSERRRVVDLVQVAQHREGEGHGHEPHEGHALVRRKVRAMRVGRVDDECVRVVVQVRWRRDPVGARDEVPPCIDASSAGSLM